MTAKPKSSSVTALVLAVETLIYFAVAYKAVLRTTWPGRIVRREHYRVPERSKVFDAEANRSPTAPGHRNECHACDTAIARNMNKTHAELCDTRRF